MGFLILARQLDKGVSVVTILVVLFAVGFFYFRFLHIKLFGFRPKGQSALVFSFIGFGLGQAYNRQFKKSAFFGILIPVLILINYYIPKGTGSSNLFTLVSFGVIALTMVDAGASSRLILAQTLKRVKQTRLNKRYLKLLNFKKENFDLAVDTNIMMHEQELLALVAEKGQVGISISMKVFDELDGLKKSDNPLTQKKAQLAFDIIESFQKNNLINLMPAPKSHEIRPFGLSHKPDEVIIGTYLKAFKEDGQKMMFLSNDKGARILARKVGLPVEEL